MTDKTKESEAAIQAKILLACGRDGTVLFRQNTAVAWVGKHQEFRRPELVLMRPGDVVIREARRLHAGLCKGSPDIVGWQPVKITADMVGTTLAVFVGLEVKSSTGRPTPEQRNFLDRLAQAGGVASVVRSPADAALALAGGAAGYGPPIPIAG